MVATNKYKFANLLITYADADADAEHVCDETGDVMEERLVINIPMAGNNANH